MGLFDVRDDHAIHKQLISQLHANQVQTLNLNFLRLLECEEVCKALISNTSLTALTLRNVGSSGSSAALAETVKVNSVLTILQLSYCKDCSIICEALPFNLTITTLHLEHCGIGDLECTNLAKMLTANTSITDINLQANNITDVGCVRLCAALSKKSSIQNLNLSKNQIRNPGFLAIRKLLSSNVNLTDVKSDVKFDRYDQLDIFNQIGDILTARQLIIEITPTIASFLEWHNFAGESLLVVQKRIKRWLLRFTQ